MFYLCNSRALITLSLLSLSSTLYGSPNPKKPRRELYPTIGRGARRSFFFSFSIFHTLSFSQKVARAENYTPTLKPRHHRPSSQMLTHRGDSRLTTPGRSLSQQPPFVLCKPNTHITTKEGKKNTFKKRKGGQPLQQALSVLSLSLAFLSCFLPSPFSVGPSLRHLSSLTSSLYTHQSTSSLPH